MKTKDTCCLSALPLQNLSSQVPWAYPTVSGRSGTQYLLLFPSVTSAKSLQTLCRCGVSCEVRPQKSSYKSLVRESFWVQQRWLPRKMQRSLETLSLLCQSCSLTPENQESRLRDLHHFCFWSPDRFQQSPRNVDFIKEVLSKMLRKYHHQNEPWLLGLHLCNLSFSRGRFACWPPHLATPWASIGLANMPRQATPALEPHITDILGFQLPVRATSLSPEKPP